MTGRMLGIERSSNKVRTVLVYGDTNSARRRALGVEAARSSCDVEPVCSTGACPKSIGADHHAADSLAPTKTSVGNLPGRDSSGAIFEVGDVMLDASRFYLDRAASRPHR
jgi:UDP-N-acetylglucosamine 2-epimerase